MNKNLTPVQYKIWLLKELKEVDKLLAKEMDALWGTSPMEYEIKLDKIADILVDMNKAFNSEEYCEGINKYNVRGVYKIWAKKILEVCK